MSTEGLDWRGGERRAHRRRHEENGEPMTAWAWLGLALIVFVSGALAILATGSERSHGDFVGALAPDEIVFLCRDAGGGRVAVTAATHFGEKEISKPKFADGESIHCGDDGLVDPRDISATGGIDGMLQFLPWKEELDSEVAKVASYSGME
ncbi:MAG: hypothetical protein Q7R58_01190 [bacterium]|nr:hypothetical protein [bacterium]